MGLPISSPNGLFLPFNLPQPQASVAGRMCMDPLSATYQLNDLGQVISFYASVSFLYTGDNTTYLDNLRRSRINFCNCTRDHTVGAQNTAGILFKIFVLTERIPWKIRN